MLSSPTLQQPLRQEKAELDFADHARADHGQGGAAISTRDTVAFGFGLEQVDEATRNALVAKAFGYLLPAHGRHGRARRPNFTYPAELTPVIRGRLRSTSRSRRFDERGDIKEVRLYAGNDSWSRPSAPSRSSSASGPRRRRSASTLTLRAEAEDKAGNVRTITRDVRVVSAQALVAVAAAGRREAGPDGLARPSARR